MDAAKQAVEKLLKAELLQVRAVMLLLLLLLLLLKFLQSEQDRDDSASQGGGDEDEKPMADKIQAEVRITSV